MFRDYWARKLYAPVHEEEVEAPPTIEYYETAQTTQPQQIEPRYQIQTRQDFLICMLQISLSELVLNSSNIMGKAIWDYLSKRWEDHGL